MDGWIGGGWMNGWVVCSVRVWVSAFIYMGWGFGMANPSGCVL